jgi:hypothetical protein
MTLWYVWWVDGSYERWFLSKEKARTYLARLGEDMGGVDRYRITLTPKGIQRFLNKHARG